MSPLRSTSNSSLTRKKTRSSSRLRNFPETIGGADRERLTKAAQDAITTGVLPSFQKLKKYFVEEYLPAAFDQVGVWQMPDGGGYYAYLARRHTTTDLTPQQIHEKGLSEVARIKAEMQTIMGKSVSRERCRNSSPNCARIRSSSTKRRRNCWTPIGRSRSGSIPTWSKVFKTLPRTPYGVTPIPDKIAPDTTTAYYNQPAADGSRAGLTSSISTSPRPVRNGR